MTPPDPHWLDASLEEVLGGQRPPDLTARILTALRAAGPTGEPEPPPVVSPPVVASSPPVVPPSLPPSFTPSPARRPVSSNRSATPPANPTLVTTAALMLLTGVGIFAYALSRRPQESGPLAQGQTPPSATVPGEADAPSAHRLAQGPRSPRSPGSRVRSPKSTAATPPQIATQRRSPDERAAATPAVPPEPTTVAEITPPTPGSTNSSTWTDQQIVSWINAQLRQGWSDAGVTPADPATDAEWCRRAYLRLLGRIPSVEELQAFADDRARPSTQSASTTPAPESSLANRRQRLVERLVGGDPRYAAEFAAHWAEQWATVLMGRQGQGLLHGASREQLAGYLREQLAAQRPFDQLVQELLTATGSNDPSAPDYNRAVHFLLAYADDKATQATSRVSRVFLGRNLQCGQCHAEPDGSTAIAQQQFWQLNSFLRQMHVERLDAGQGVRLVNRDFRGDGQDASDAAVFYELGTGQLRAAYPVFLDDAELPHSGLVAEFDRRQELARKVVASSEFRRTVVNRLWAHFLGFGLVNPVDDLGPHNPPSHPALLDQLADQFAAHQFNLRDVTRWIVLSDGFGLSSRAQPDKRQDAPELGQRPLFSHYYARPMQVEQLYESLRMLADARRQGTDGKTREPASREFLGRVARQLGADRLDDSHAIIQTVPNSLARADDELTRSVLAGAQGSLIDRVAGNEKMSADAKIEHLFQAALARRPTSQELQAARELLTLNPNDPQIGLRDLWWALLNSNEFLLDH